MESEPVNENMSMKTSHRIRAKLACTVCRMRKVRCDVASSGSPCTNCRLDAVSCKVVPRKRKWDRQVNASILPNLNLSQEPLEPLPIYPSSQSHDGSSLEGEEGSATLPTPYDTSALANLANLTNITEEPESQNLETAFNSSDASLLFSNDLLYEDFFGPFVSDDLQDGAEEQNEAPPPPFVPFSYYNFVDPGTIEEQCHEDVAFMDRKGCLKLPSEPILNEFFYCYFAHVHTVVPIMNEVEFWAEDARIPLFVLQAMLFVTCPYMSLPTLLSLGFPSVQAAQAEFYIRAKTLHHFDIHDDNIMKARGTLMLTYYSSSPDDYTNTYWLMNTIHYARCAHADRYYDIKDGHYSKITLKRLWWCCLARDSLMSLSLHRPLVVGSSEFDLSRPCVTFSDMSDELDKSKVYDSAAKNILAHFGVALCELSIPVHKVLSVIYPRAPSKASQSEQDQKQLKACAEGLRCLDEWHQKIKATFENTALASNFPKPLILYPKMLYLYYYSARATLCHHMTLIFIASLGSSGSINKGCLRAQSLMDLSLHCITGSFMQLAQLDLVGYLPNTFVAFSALPLTWQVLSAKLMNPGDQVAETRRNLQVYIGVMSTFRNLYKHADIILESIKNAITYIQETETFDVLKQDCNALTVYPPATVLHPSVGTLEWEFYPTNKWAKLLFGKPRTYLRIATTIDRSLASGKLPSEVEFPMAAKTLHRPASQSIGEKYQDEDEYQDQDQEKDSFYDYLIQTEDLF